MTVTNPNAMGVQIFKNPKFGEVRTAGTSEKPLFCLSDLCKVLNLTNPSVVANRLDIEDRPKLDLGYKNGQKITFVTESGFYDVVIRSDSPKAKPFRKWVTSEVLPSIRKTGGYSSKSSKAKLRQASDIYPVKEFSSPYGYIRVTSVEGEVMFCYPDIWHCLGLSNGTALKSKLNPNGFRYLETPTGGGVQVLAYIDEPNLSRIFSRKSSKDITIFQGWIENEVLTVMRSEQKEIEIKTEIIEEPEPLPETVPMKLCPELAEIVGGACILIQQLERYKTLSGVSSQSISMCVAENSLNLLKESLKTLYQEAYIKDMERNISNILK